MIETGRSRQRLLLASLLLLTAPRLAFAQNAGCTITVDSRTLEVSEATDAKLVCRNTDVPGLPAIAAPVGLEVQMLSSSPSQSSFTQIINGRVSSESSYTFLLRLTGIKPGDYMLGPISVAAGRQTYQSNAVAISVKEPTVDPTANGDRVVFVELSVDPPALYVTQSLTAELTLGIRKVEIGGRIYEFDLLRNVLDQRSSQFSVFGDPTDRTIRTTEQTLNDSQGGAHHYEVFRLTKRLRADTVGEIAIGPVFIKVNYPTRLKRGFWGGLEATQAASHSARAMPITVTVQAPPEEGRPPTYTGSIGRYTFEVTAKPNRIEKGQPITLSLRIRGAPLDGVGGPDLTQQADLAGRFDFTAEEPVGESEGGARVFRKAVFPKQVGEQNIPPLEWSYFDPNAEQYVTLRSNPIPITVDPASDAPSVTTLAPGVEAPPPDKPTMLKVLTGGISPNIVDRRLVLVDQSVTLSAASTAALLGSPLAWLVVTLLVRHRERTAGDPRFARRRRARRRALAGIQRAKRNGQAHEQLAMLASTFTGYVADRFGQCASALTPKDIRAILADHDVNGEVQQAMVEFLDTCDAARYAPGEALSLSITDAADRVRRWIDLLERWEKE